MKAVSPALWPSPRGIWVLLVLCVLLAAASIVPVALDVVAVCAAIVAAFAAADLRAGPGSADLDLARDVAAHVTVGKPARLEYTLTNRAGTRIAARVHEATPASVTFADDATAVALAPRARATFVREFVAHERGLVRFAAAYLRIENGIGLLTRRFALAAPLDVRVYPDFSAVEGYGTLARRSTLLESGMRRLRLRGAGSEFESLREYATGDAFRAIDWKASARRGRLMVAQYDVERSQQILLALDAGRLMTPRIGSQRKFDYALTAALSAARVAQIAGDNVGLVAFAARPLCSVVPRRGVAHHAALVRAAYDLQPRLEEPDYERMTADLARRYAKRSLVVVFTDLFDPASASAVLSSLAVLVPRHLVVCVLMNDAAIARALAADPRTPRDAYRASVAMQLEDERRGAVATLRARGIIVVDAPAARLTVALIDTYLDVKARALL